MKWSTQKINDIKKYVVDNSTLNVTPILRQLQINTILDEIDYPSIFPYNTTDHFISLPFLRRFNIGFDYTDEELSFLSNLKSDPIALSKFIEIPDKRGSRINFNLYPKQKEFISHYLYNRFNIIKHSRQVGVSHLLTLVCLHYIITNQNKTVLWICTQHKHSFDRFMEFIQQIPFFISPGVKFKDNKVEFDNGCVIRFTKDVETIKSGIDFLIVDHGGFIQLKEIISKVSPYLSFYSDTKCIIASSPSKNSDFNKLFQDSNWNKFILNWDAVPERDSFWVQDMTNLLGGFQFFLDEYHVDDSIESKRDLSINSLIFQK